MAAAEARLASPLVLAMEIGTAFWIRDNLTLNIVMLVHPVDAIREWQSEGRPR